MREKFAIAKVNAILGVIFLAFCMSSCEQIIHSSAPRSDDEIAKSRGFTKISDTVYSLGGDMLFDIRNSTSQAFVFGKGTGINKGVSPNALRWPNGIVTYKFDVSLVPEARNSIRATMNEFESVTPIRFIESANGKLIIDANVTPPTGGSASVGYPGDSDAAKGSLHITEGGPILLHELCHVVGLMHEHQRFDRDNYITVREERLIQVWKDIGAFRAYSADMSNVLGTYYDYASITHYKNRRDLTTDGSEIFDTRGQTVSSSQLSPLDIWTIKKMYLPDPGTMPSNPYATITTPTEDRFFPNYIIAGSTFMQSAGYGGTSIHFDGVATQDTTINFNLPSGLNYTYSAKIDFRPNTGNAMSATFNTPTGAVPLTTSPKEFNLSFTGNAISIVISAGFDGTLNIVGPNLRIVSNTIFDPPSQIIGPWGNVPGIRSLGLLATSAGAGIYIFRTPTGSNFRFIADYQRRSDNPSSDYTSVVFVGSNLFVATNKWQRIDQVIPGGTVIQFYGSGSLNWGIEAKNIYFISDLPVTTTTTIGSSQWLSEITPVFSTQNPATSTYDSSAKTASINMSSQGAFTGKITSLSAPSEYYELSCDIQVIGSGNAVLSTPMKTYTATNTWQPISCNWQGNANCIVTGNTSSSGGIRFRNIRLKTFQSYTAPTISTTTTTIPYTASGSWVSIFTQADKTAYITGQTGGGGELVFHTESGYNYRVMGSLRLRNGQAIPGGGGCQILYPGNQIEASTTWTPFDITFAHLGDGYPFKLTGWGPTAGGLEISNLVITKLSAAPAPTNIPRVLLSISNASGATSGWTNQTTTGLVKDPQQPYAAMVRSATIQGSGSGSGEIVYELNPNSLNYEVAGVPSPYRYLISGNLITSGIGSITASFSAGSTSTEFVSTNLLGAKIPFTFVFSTGSFTPTFSAIGSGTVRAQLTDLRFCIVETVSGQFSKPTGTNIGGYSNNYFIDSSKAETHAAFIPNSNHVGKKITVQGSIGRYGSSTTSASFSPATDGSFIYGPLGTQKSFSTTRFCTSTGFTAYYGSPYTYEPQTILMKLLGLTFYAYVRE